MQKYFSVNEGGHSIRCKIYCTDTRNIDKIVLCGHGFGGHKDNKAAEKYAERLMSKYKRIGLATFDLPSHGEDVKKRIELKDCYAYLRLVTEHIKEKFDVDEIYAYGTSFTGYLFLSYIKKFSNPYKKLALRCPAVKMYEVITNSIMSDDAMEKLAKGKDALIGFDRKIAIDQGFLNDLKNNDIFSEEFFDFADDILIIHGTKDEIVPIEYAEKFADENCIEFIAVQNADHRFQDKRCMDTAMKEIDRFFGF